MLWTALRTAMSTRIFSLASIAAILLWIGFIGLFNRIVDPYWYFRDIEIPGLNSDKPKAAGNEWLVKPALTARLEPEAVIVGNSVAEIGLPPLHRGFTADGALVAFNLAMPRATWDETYCLAMFAMRQAPVKRLVVGISGADEPACPSDTALGRADYGRLLFSRAAFQASRETVRLQGQRTSMTREGLWYFDRYDERSQSDDHVAGDFAVVMQGRLCPSVSGNPRELDRGRLDRTAPPRDVGRGLRTLIRLALERRVELVLLFYPIHVLLNEAERNCRGPEAHWNWVWRIVSIVEQETGGDSRNVQVWQFAGYAPMNAERVHAGKPKRDRLWQDLIHFNEEVGAAVFDAIYSGSPRWGARVTVANIDQAIARSEVERTRFLADNPWMQPELDEIVGRARTLSAPSHR